jgi:hypothetical protein
LISNQRETMTATNPSEQTALAVMPGAYDLSPRNFEEAWRMAEYLADSDMVPKDFKGKPANCLIAIQWGGELGLKTMQAIQNIAVINGRPSLWGDVMLALVRNSPLCEYVVEDIAGRRCRVQGQAPRRARAVPRVHEGRREEGRPVGQGKGRGSSTRSACCRCARARGRCATCSPTCSRACRWRKRPWTCRRREADGPGRRRRRTAPAGDAREEGRTRKAEFDADKAAWQKAINKGKTPQDIFEAIALRRPEYELSEEQKAVVNSMKKEVIENGAPTDVTPEGRRPRRKDRRKQASTRRTPATSSTKPAMTSSSCRTPTRAGAFRRAGRRAER